MGVLPSTGTQIDLGRINQSYTNVAPTPGSNINLSDVAETNTGKPINTQTDESNWFGGRTTPFNY